ncbi:MAG: methyl-accepting chemotaxis protein [Spirochaetota bacterium]
MRKSTVVAHGVTILLTLGAAALAWQGPSLGMPSVLAPATSVAAAIAAIAALGLSVRAGREAERAARRRLDAAEERRAERDALWERNVADLEREIERLRADSASDLVSKRRLAHAIGLVRETQPIIAGLAHKAIEKSELGSTSLTEDIYELGKQSTGLSESISGFLTELCTGDESLADSVEDLMADMERLGETAKLCDEANTSLDSSITKVSKSVSETSELLGQVSDIAEQTSILAINAAIYAAKAGEYGPGFSVIAGEIQALARTAKEVAETIGTNTSLIERQVGDFGRTHRDLMGASQQSLKRTIDSLRRTADGLRPKVERISSSIQDAARVSEWVAEHLNGINMAMQEQDAIQQIVSHISLIVRDALEQVPEAWFAEALEQGSEEARQLARDLAARHFTMRDEFVATGHDGYRETGRGTAVLKDGTRLGGDVTLF